MKTSRIIGKLCSALILFILMTIAMQHEFASRRQMSREDYLAKQGERYDRQVNRPSPFVLTFIACGFVAGVFLGVYELIGFGISKAAKGIDDEPT